MKWLLALVFTLAGTALAQPTMTWNSTTMTWNGGSMLWGASASLTATSSEVLTGGDGATGVLSRGRIIQETVLISDAASGLAAHVAVTQETILTSDSGKGSCTYLMTWNGATMAWQSAGMAWGPCTTIFNTRSVSDGYAQSDLSADLAAHFASAKESLLTTDAATGNCTLFMSWNSVTMTWNGGSMAWGICVTATFSRTTSDAFAGGDRSARSLAVYLLNSDINVTRDLSAGVHGAFASTRDTTFTNDRTMKSFLPTFCKVIMFSLQIRGRRIRFTSAHSQRYCLLVILASVRPGTWPRRKKLFSPVMRPDDLRRT